MKLRTFLAGAALAALFAAAPVVAHAEHHDGDSDEHHAWHNSDWWHDNHPGWVYRHHPEWAETHNDWRRTDGDWDDHHDVVMSEKGKRLSKPMSKEKAKKRLTQIEFFKHRG